MKEPVVKRLTRDNVGTFFTKMTRGDIVIYSEAFLLESVYKLAYNHGWLINHFPPGTEEYSKYGSRTCKTMWRV